MLASFEDVIEALGTISDDVGVMQRGEVDFEFLMAGAAFQKLVGQPLLKTTLSSLDANYQVAFRIALVRSLGEAMPVSTTVRYLVNGRVGTAEFVAIPLTDRKGRLLFLVFLKAHETTYDIAGAIIEATADGLATLGLTIRSGTPDFDILSANPGAAKLLGHAGRDLRWSSISKILPYSEATTFIQSLLEATRSGSSGRFEQRLEGTPVTHMLVSVVPVGDLLGVVLSDITEMKVREEASRLVFDSNPMPMTVYDVAECRIIRANTAALSHFGYSESVLKTLHPLDLHPEEDRPALVKIMDSQSGHDGLAVPFRHLTSEGQRRDVLIYSRGLTVAGRECILSAIVDVTIQRQVEARDRFLAYNDALTLLPNRASLLIMLREGMFSSCNLALAVHCIDLDLFRRVNNMLGYPAGDEVLRTVGSRLSRVVGEADMVARLGGDEFAIIQFDGDKGKAADLAARAIAALAEPIFLDGQEIIIGSSIGIAITGKEGADAERILNQADVALRASKEAGKETFRFFEPEMEARLQKRLALETMLRVAVSEQAFELHYQPILNLAEGSIIGCEALLRWRPTGGTHIPPDEFIPVAEDLGLIVSLGEWVLREACLAATEWPSDTFVAINLSPVQFKAGNLVAIVEAALAVSGLPPARLELEITESVLLAESAANIATLHRLRALGVRISIDDFGKGFSSLNYLRVFPFDKLKIDRAFVAEIAFSHESLAIVTSIIGLGKELGIRILAEGIENKAQAEMLRCGGCLEGQGFLFSRPLPLSELRHLLAVEAGSASSSVSNSLSLACAPR